jgi:hypothetical protein
MNDKEIDLRSVNWERGMLLTPEHFLRQERYVESLFAWVLRYAVESYGLVGAGPRTAPTERGAVSHDPVVSVHDDGVTLKVSVTQCRGISPSGDIIDINPAHAVHQSFPRKELEEQRELGIYVVAEPHARAAEEGPEDAANPQMKSARWQQYHIKPGITGAEAAHSILLARLRKGEGLQFEKVADFIPVCTTLVSYSALMRAWERLRDQLVHLTDRYTLLHKAIVEYVSLAAERGIDTREDEETLQFVGRMVVTLESCIYEVVNPLQSPQRFFQQMYRAIRSASVYLDLSPPAKDYFRHLAEAGENEFGSLMEQERQTLLTGRELTVHDNLSLDVQRIESALFRLRRLEEALEGKYWDFRLSTALEALNFFFDRQYDPPALFQSSAKPSRPQLFGNELTFVFAPRNLEERRSYRLILIGRSETPLEVGTTLSAEIRINAGAGQVLRPIRPEVECELPGQRNFALDFDAPPNIQAITDLRVVISASLPIKSCLLYVRRHIQRVAPQTYERRRRVETPDPVWPPDPPDQPEGRVPRLAREPAAQTEMPDQTDVSAFRDLRERRVRPAEPASPNVRRRRVEPVDGD